MGISEARILTESDIEKVKKDFNVNNNLLYKVSKDDFTTTFEEIKKSNSNVYKQYAQPVQLIIFDKNRSNILHLVNCNIGGIPLKWNRYHSFDYYPIAPMNFSQPSRKILLSEVLSILTPKISKEEIDNIFNKYEYIYFVFYGKFVKGPSKGLSNSLKMNKEKNPNQSVYYYYILTDELYVE